MWVGGSGVHVSVELVLGSLLGCTFLFWVGLGGGFFGFVSVVGLVFTGGRRDPPGSYVDYI